jgi:hypothetical protein
MVSFGLVLAGAVSATSNMNGLDPKNVTDLNVTVLDENSQPVEEASVGDKVTAEIKASSTKLIKDPVTTIEVDPKNGIKFNADEAQMWDGTSWILNSEDPFLYKLGDAWIWEMGRFLCPGTELILQLPGKVCNIGEINVTADLYGAVVKHNDRHDGNYNDNCNDNNWFRHDGKYNDNCNDNNWFRHDGKYNDDCKGNHHDSQIRLLDTANYLFNAECNPDTSVDVNILDPTDNTPITTALVGDEVNVEVIANAATQFVKDSYMIINFNPPTKLDFDPATVMMWNGISWITNDPNNNPFFFEENGAWTWKIDGIMNPGDVFKLLILAIAAETGKVNVTAQWYGYLKCDPSDPNACFLPELCDLGNDTSDPLTIETGSTAGGGDNGNGAAAGDGNIATANAADTVPLQNTGTPLALAILALFAIVGGSIYGRLK